MTTDPRVLMGEGVPYVPESYQDMGGEGQPALARRRELPMDKMVVDFGTGGRRK